MAGILRKGMKIPVDANGRVFDGEAVGVPPRRPWKLSSCQPAKWIIFGHNQEPVRTKTATRSRKIRRPAAAPLAGSKTSSPWGWPDSTRWIRMTHTWLRDAARKLRLNELLFFFGGKLGRPGDWVLRCGFMWMLHMEIIQSAGAEFKPGHDSRPRPGLRYKTITLRTHRGCESREPVSLARSARHRKDRRASDHCHHLHQRSVCRGI